MLRRVLKEGGIYAEVMWVEIKNLRLNFGRWSMAVKSFLDNNISFRFNSLKIQVTLHSLPRFLLVIYTSHVNDPTYYLYFRKFTEGL